MCARHVTNVYSCVQKSESLTAQVQALEILDELESGSRKAVALEAGCQQAQLAFLAAVGEVTVDVDPLQEVLASKKQNYSAVPLGTATKLTRT